MATRLTDQSLPFDSNEYYSEGVFLLKVKEELPVLSYFGNIGEDTIGLTPTDIK